MINNRYGLYYKTVMGLAPGAIPINLFEQIYSLFCKLGHFIIVPYFRNCNKTLKLTKRTS